MSTGQTRKACSRCFYRSGRRREASRAMRKQLVGRARGPESRAHFGGSAGAVGDRGGGLFWSGAPRGQGADDGGPVGGGSSGQGEFGAAGGGVGGGACGPGAGVEPGEGERTGGRGEAELASAREGGSTPGIFYAGGDPPRGEFVGEAGKAVAIARGPGGVAVPIGAAQDAFAVDEGGCDRAEGRGGEPGAGCGGGG
jgi:hypothetical protein